MKKGEHCSTSSDPTQQAEKLAKTLFCIHLNEGRHPNGLLGLSLNDWTILSLEILLDRTVSVG